MQVGPNFASRVIAWIALMLMCIDVGCKANRSETKSTVAPATPQATENAAATNSPVDSSTVPPASAPSSLADASSDGGDEAHPETAVPAEGLSGAELPAADEPSGVAGPLDVVESSDVADSSEAPESRGELGKQLYARHCAACHGDTGDGRGIAAAHLFPKPRDFHAGRFRLVSTANNVPSREDLHAVLMRGMPGSSMPPWGHLSQDERDALVDEIMYLRKAGAASFYIRLLKEEEGLTDEEIAEEDIQQDIRDYVDNLPEPGESSVVPEIQPATEGSIARGAQTYGKFGCIQCHGKDGKGNGVEKMVDSEGYATAPRDFTAGIFKGGDDPASLYRRIAYGMPGTPMPSSQQMTPDAMIDLVHYVRAMSKEEDRKSAVLNRAQIIVRKVSSLPSEFSDPAWAEIPSATIKLVPLWWRNDTARDVSVQGVHDGRSMAVRLSWEDTQSDGHAASSEAFEDAVAMQFYRGVAEPFLGMGDPESPVDVWFWDADRQGSPLAVEQLYPNAVVDVYPFSETVPVSAEIDREGARTAHQPDISLPARASGNQIVPPGSESGGTSLVGGGPGSSTFRLPTSQLVHAVGEWRDGRWVIVMQRPLAVPSESDGITLAPADRASVAFAIWDGAADDRDGKKSITIWQDLILEQ